MAGENVAQSKLGSGCCTMNILIQIIFFLIWTALGVALIVVGAIHKNDCPQNPWIPIYMIVAGAFSFAYWIVLPVNCFFPTIRKILGLLVALFVFAWFIAGSVWVFRIYRPNNCHHGTYYYVFSILLIQWIFLAIGVIGALISCFCCKNSCVSEMLQCICPCLGGSECCSSCQCLQCCNSCQCLESCSSCCGSCQCLECCNSCQCLECCNSCQCLECCSSCQCLECCNSCQCLQNCSKCCPCSSCLDCSMCSQCCKCSSCCAPVQAC